MLAFIVDQINVITSQWKNEGSAKTLKTKKSVFRNKTEQKKSVKNISDLRKQHSVSHDFPPTNTLTH